MQAPPQPHCSKLRLLVISACLFLGYVLIRLPTTVQDTNLHRQQLNTTDSLAFKPSRKGGAVRLADVPAIPVNHKSSGAMKQVKMLCSDVNYNYTMQRSQLSSLFLRVMLRPLTAVSCRRCLQY
jgi:hypothetical protein